jgi:NAD(P)-dependent dehydrogenase (short-subunit alcohol dehydrogenase family)
MAQDGSRRLSGKVALVTGAGSQGPGVGTGKAMSVLFAREGARVCLVDLNAARAEETLAMIHEEGGQGTVLEGDVSNEADCDRLIAEALAAYGSLDILVNNAAIVGPMGPVAGLDLTAWNRVLSINLTGVMLMTKAALGALMKEGGSIINISSTGAMVSTGQTPAYGASKAAIIRLTADLAVSYGRNGIRVNAIAPGNIHTPMVSGAMTPEARVLRQKGSPLGTEGTAWDIAYAALFLVSDEARWITGVCLPVDGGMTQTNPTTIHAWLSS